MTLRNEEAVDTEEKKDEEKLDPFFKGDIENIDRSISEDLGRIVPPEEEPGEGAPEPEPAKDDDEPKVKVGDKEYTREELAAILAKQDQPAKPEKKEPGESEKIKKLRAQRKDHEGDEAVQKVIDTMIEQEQRLEKLEAKELADKELNEQKAADDKVNRWRKEIEDEYGIKVPALRTKEFQAWVDASNESNPLRFAVAKLFPDKVGGKKEVKVPKRMPTPTVDSKTNEAPEDMDPEMYAETVRAAKAAGMNVDEVLKHRRK